MWYASILVYLLSRSHPVNLSCCFTSHNRIVIVSSAHVTMASIAATVLVIFVIWVATRLFIWSSSESISDSSSDSLSDSSPDPLSDWVLSASSSSLSPQLLSSSYGILLWLSSTSPSSSSFFPSSSYLLPIFSHLMFVAFGIGFPCFTM